MGNNRISTKHTELMDFTSFDEIAARQYAWTIDDDGVLHGLVAGDMGYDSTDVKLCDLLGSAISIAFDRGHSESRDWSLDNQLQDALSKLIAVCREAHPKAAESPEKEERR